MSDDGLGICSRNSCAVKSWLAPFFTTGISNNFSQSEGSAQLAADVSYIPRPASHRPPKGIPH